jgi:hypothetical protein
VAMRLRPVNAPGRTSRVPREDKRPQNPRIFFNR